MTRAQIALLAARCLAVLLFGLLALLHPWTASIEPALSAALLSLALLILVHLVIDLGWAQLVSSGGTGSVPNYAGAVGPLVGLIVTTAGVILGLLQAFGTGQLSQTVQVAVISLVVAVLLGLILFGMVVQAAPKGLPAIIFRAFVFNLTLWALGLGLLSLGWALVYRESGDLKESAVACRTESLSRPVFFGLTPRETAYKNCSTFSPKAG